jgi:hypothetical protein
MGHVLTGRTSVFLFRQLDLWVEVAPDCNNLSLYIRRQLRLRLC